MKNTQQSNIVTGALSRRHFLRVAAVAAAGAPFIFPSRLRAESPNGKLNHACIGVGRQGELDLKNLLTHNRIQIVALCDVDSQHLTAAAKLVPGARLYSDWREMFEKEGNKIDSVNVTVPDHNHYVIAHTAIQRGKHVYCQKPMCHDLTEVRVLTTEAIHKGVVTQLGVQHSSQIADRMTVEILKGGAIGKIKHVYLCSTRRAENRFELPHTPTGEPPSYLRWDVWIGTAPMRPYVPNRPHEPNVYHPARWRSWQDFGTSWCADMGPHLFDATWRSLGLKAPTTVVARVEESWLNSKERRADNWPHSEQVTWTFPGNELIDGNELTVDWFDGAFDVPKEVRDLVPTEARELAAHKNGKKKEKAKDYPFEAALLIGTNGILLKEIDSAPLLFPREKFKTYARPKLRGRDHYHQFVDACLGNAKAEANFAQTGPMMEAILLGTVAIRCPGQRLTWDAPLMKIPNHPDAERFLKRQYRDGWQVS